jgi:hypothetical protein
MRGNCGEVVSLCVMEGGLYEGGQNKKTKIHRTRFYVNLQYYPISVNRLRNVLYKGVSY